MKGLANGSGERSQLRPPSRPTTLDKTRRPPRTIRASDASNRRRGPTAVLRRDRLQRVRKRVRGGWWRQRSPLRKPSVDLARQGGDLLGQLLVLARQLGAIRH